jgi:hypothetical protein
MNNLKKYLVWFLVALLWVWTMTYAAGNGTIGDLFENISGQWKLLWSNIKDETIWSWKLIDNSVSSNVIEWDTAWNECNWMSCVWYCLNTANNIVWMKWMNNTENYDECFTTESGTLIKTITYYK